MNAPRKNLTLFAVALFLSSSMNAYAAGSSEEKAQVGSNRMQNKIGSYIGILGDPFPTIIGVNLAYNLLDFMRVSAGLGQVSVTAGDSKLSATTVGGGVRFFVPDWSISPVAGLSFAHLGFSKEGPDIGSLEIKGLNQDTSLFYASVGVDWQAASGFNLGVGYNVPFKGGVGGAPYVNLGWFFGFI